MLLTSAIQLVNIGPKPSYSPLYQVVDTTSTHDASWSHIVLKQKGLALGRNFLLGGGNGPRRSWECGGFSVWGSREPNS